MWASHPTATILRILKLVPILQQGAGGVAGVCGCGLGVGVWDWGQGRGVELRWCGLRVGVGVSEGAGGGGVWYGMVWWCSGRYEQGAARPKPLLVFCRFIFVILDPSTGSPATCPSTSPEHRSKTFRDPVTAAVVQ